MTTTYERLAAVIAASPRFGPVRHHRVLTSTNAWLADRPELPLGTVVVADRQTQGRGRVGRTWENSPTGPGGSLLCSTTVAPPSVASRVPLLAGLAVVEAVTAHVDDPDRVACKWPNDVLVDGRKVAGLLLSHLTPPASPASTRVRDRQSRRRRAGELFRSRVVIGIGVDVDWRGTERDAERLGWTSVAEAAGRAVDRWDVLADVLAALDRQLDAAEADAHVAMRAYRERCATIGRRVRITVVRAPSPPVGMAGVPGGGAMVGEAVDVMSDGTLLLRTDDGAEHMVWSGDVAHVRPDGAS